MEKRRPGRPKHPERLTMVGTHITLASYERMIEIVTSDSDYKAMTEIIREALAVWIRRYDMKQARKEKAGDKPDQQQD